jgi:hypothetical protein
MTVTAHNSGDPMDSSGADSTWRYHRPPLTSGGGAQPDNPAGVRGSWRGEFGEPLAAAVIHPLCGVDGPIYLIRIQTGSG